MKTLEEVLVDTIEKANGAVDKAVDFAIEQAPEIIQQALMWNMVESIAECIMSLILFYGITLFIKRALSVIKSVSEKDPEIVIIGFIIGGVLSGCVFVYAATLMNLTWLKIWIAPKLWLIEYAASLAK